MTKAEILSDLDYVKSMAEEGRNTPLLGGRIGLWWGGLLCVTLFAHWMIITGKAGLNGSFSGMLWMAFGIIGVIGNIVLERSLRGKPGGSSTNNRVEAAVWAGSAIFLLSFGFASGLSAGLGFADYTAVNIVMPVAFGIYGLASYVTGKISGQNWLMLPGLLGFVMMIGLLFMLTSPHLYLLSIFGVIGTIIIPSFIHLRREPSDVV